MREFMARSGDRGVTASMITHRLKSGGFPVSDRTVRRWLADDADAGIIERMSHLQWRMRRPDTA
jgi:Fe2+ or Zn2+ uptake regulation protein